MKNSHLFAILCAVYIAPHLTPTIGFIGGIYFIAFSLYYARKES